MNAARAAQLAAEARDRATEGQVVLLLEEVEKAARKGQFAVVLEVEVSTHVLERLTTLGYETKSNTHRNEHYLSIGWGEGVAAAQASAEPSPPTPSSPAPSTSRDPRDPGPSYEAEEFRGAQPKPGAP